MPLFSRPTTTRTDTPPDSHAPSHSHPRSNAPGSSSASSTSRTTTRSTTRRAKYSTFRRNVAYSARIVIHTLVLVVLIALADGALMVALVVKLFSPRLGWKMSCWTAERFWRYMQDYFEHSRNARPAIHVTGDGIPKGEAAVVLTNHLSYADFYLTQHLAVKAGMLGQCRYFAKRELVWMIPLFGWAFWAMDMILVSRNWTKDERSIKAAFSRITTPHHRTWLSLCPEGTRLSPSKLLQSQAFSTQHYKPVLDHLLWPRTRGFAATIQGMREDVGAVYDLTYLYVTPAPALSHRRLIVELPSRKRGSTPRTAEVAKRSTKTGRVPSLAELVGTGDLEKEGYEFRIHVRRFPISDLPTTEEALKVWCEDRWVEKDEILRTMRAEAGIEGCDEYVAK